MPFLWIQYYSSKGTGMDGVGHRGSNRDLGRAWWGWAQARQGWDASLAGQQSSQHLGPFFLHLLQGHGVGSCSFGGRRLPCLQLMEVVPDVRAAWGSSSWAMTAESPLWPPQVCQSNYKRLLYVIRGSGPTYLTGLKYSVSALQVIKVTNFHFFQRVSLNKVGKWFYRCQIASVHSYISVRYNNNCLSCFFIFTQS